MADPTRACGEPAVVIVDRVPRILALHTEDGVEFWVIVLPTGDAVLIDTDGHVSAHTSLERIRSRRSRRGGARLVEVIGDPAEVRVA